MKRIPLILLWLVLGGIILLVLQVFLDLIHFR